MGITGEFHIGNVCLSSQSSCSYFWTGGINWIAAKIVKVQVSQISTSYTLQWGEISVFDVIISMAGLLIPFNSSCDSGQAWPKTHEWNTKELLKAHSSISRSVLLHLLMHPNASPHYVDEKQDFHIRCSAVESRFLLEATFVHRNQHFSCLSESSSRSINGSVCYLKQALAACHYSAAQRDGKHTS